MTKGPAEMVAAAIRITIAEPTANTVRDAVENVPLTRERQFPMGAALLGDTRQDIASCVLIGSATSGSPKAATYARPPWPLLDPEPIPLEPPASTPTR